MSTAALKKKIKALIDKETNVRKLELTYALLTEGTSEVSEPGAPYTAPGKGRQKNLRGTPSARGVQDAVITSEREFAEGKGIPLEQFEQEMDAMLDEIFSDASGESAGVAKKASIPRTKRTRS